MEEILLPYGGNYDLASYKGDEEACAQIMTWRNQNLKIPKLTLDIPKWDSSTCEIEIGFLDENGVVGEKICTKIRLLQNVGQFMFKDIEISEVSGSYFLTEELNAIRSGQYVAIPLVHEISILRSKDVYDNDKYHTLYNAYVNFFFRIYKRSAPYTLDYFRELNISEILKLLEKIFL